jgi:anti-sigma B factor antagonist
VATRKTTLEISATETDQDTVMTVAGALDIATVDQLEAAAMEALERGHSVVLDVSGLTLCDSTGLGALVRIYRRAQAMGLTFGLHDPRQHVADLLAMTGINKVIPVTGVK